MFCFIFLIFVVDCTHVRHQFEDDHPFITDDDDSVKNDEKNHDKFMLIPSIGYEMMDKSGKFLLILNGWYYEPLNPSRFSRLEIKNWNWNFRFSTKFHKN
jgi:hypothetical protein